MPSADHSHQRLLYQQRVSSLFELQHQSSREKRDAYVARLRQLDERLLFDVLIELERHHDAEVRCDAAEALLRIDANTSIPLVLPLLEDPLNYVRWHICGLLHDFGDTRTVEPLARVVLNDHDPGVRHVACWALGKVGDSRALAALRWAQQNDKGTDYEGDPVRRMAEGAIKEILTRQS